MRAVDGVFSVGREEGEEEGTDLQVQVEAVGSSVVRRYWERVEGA